MNKDEHAPPFYVIKRSCVFTKSQTKHGLEVMPSETESKRERARAPEVAQCHFYKSHFRPSLGCTHGPKQPETKRTT